MYLVWTADSTWILLEILEGLPKSYKIKLLPNTSKNLKQQGQMMKNVVTRKQELEFVLQE